MPSCSICSERDTKIERYDLGVPGRSMADRNMKLDRSRAVASGLHTISYTIVLYVYYFDVNENDDSDCDSSNSTRIDRRETLGKQNGLPCFSCSDRML